MENDHIWIVACVLTKQAYNGLSISQTISWRSGGTENEAIGQAVQFSKHEKPDYAIEMITPTKVVGVAATGSESGSKITMTESGPVA